MPDATCCRSGSAWRTRISSMEVSALSDARKPSDGPAAKPAAHGHALGTLRFTCAEAQGSMAPHFDHGRDHVQSGRSQRSHCGGISRSGSNRVSRSSHHVRPAERAHATARQLSAVARSRRANAARGAAAMGVGPGPARALSLQRQRVPRRHARRVQGASGAVQRQLPLRRRGTGLSAEQRARTRDHLSRELCAARCRGSRQSSVVGSVHPGGRRIGQCAAARRRRL